MRVERFNGKDKSTKDVMVHCLQRYYIDPNKKKFDCKEHSLLV